jgi:uroporphyrinogen-III synthase
MPSLSNLRVLLTRPIGQATQLGSRIVAAGGSVQSLPLLAINPIDQREDVERVKAAILCLDHYDIAIFISTNAASLGLDWIDQYWPQLPMGLDAYAVGPGTAQILRRLTWLVHCSSTGVTSEDLLGLHGLQDIQGKRVALFRGQGGRELIASALRERGARVDYIELYQRSTPRYDKSELLKLIEESTPNTVVLTSLQIFEAYHGLIVSLDSSRDTEARALISLLRSPTLIVPSERVRQCALEAGYNRVLNAGGADDQTVFNALQQRKSDLDQERNAR